jgi:hypothetical protein
MRRLSHARATPALGAHSLAGFAISLMKVILTARKAFEAYLIISAVSTFVSTRRLVEVHDAYTFFMASRALAGLAPEDDPVGG